jgi:hypothetical protein
MDAELQAANRLVPAARQDAGWHLLGMLGAALRRGPAGEGEGESVSEAYEEVARLEMIDRNTGAFLRSAYVLSVRHSVLRDLFASAALCGMLSSMEITDIRDESMGLWAYELADAMLAAREGKVKA